MERLLIEMGAALETRDTVNMARDLVHDLNNSLSSMIGYADFLVMDLAEGTPERKFAEKIHEAGIEAQECLNSFRAELLKQGTGT